MMESSIIPINCKDLQKLENGLKVNIFFYGKERSQHGRTNLGKETGKKLRDTTYCCYKELSSLTSMSTALNFQASLLMAE